MMKKLFLISFLALGYFSNAQSQEQKVAVLTEAPATKEDIYSPLRPADANPYKFPSEEELAKARPLKKASLMDQIKNNQGNPEKITQLREQLWRLENAIIINTKK